MNEHINSIIWYFSWPILIFISYRIVLAMLKIFNKNLKKTEIQDSKDAS